MQAAVDGGRIAASADRFIWARIIIMTFPFNTENRAGFSPADRTWHSEQATFMPRRAQAFTWDPSAAATSKLLI